MTMPATLGGGVAVSFRAAPVKSSMYTWRYAGLHCKWPGSRSPWRCSARRSLWLKAGGRVHGIASPAPLW
eukprot:580947-Prymnesium_polylepis.1